MDAGSPCPFTKVGNFFWKSPKIRFDFVVQAQKKLPGTNFSPIAQYPIVDKYKIGLYRHMHKLGQLHYFELPKKNEQGG